MPELPEVETLRLGLQKYLVGHKIVKIDVIDRKLFEGSEKDLVGATFKNTRRYGKGIVMDLSNGYSIAVHIKLTGQLVFRNPETKDLPVQKPTPQPVPNKFTRVVFQLEGSPSTHSINSGQAGSGSTTSSKSPAFLYFQEVRGFAWMKVIKTDQLKDLPFFKSLGPEPMPSPGSGTPKLTEEKFSEIVSKSNLPIKVLLMEQKKIGGIGNIYANDACWDAKIDPRRKAKELLQEDIKTLYASILKVLENGLKYKGSSELNFVDVLGQTGSYQEHALIYGRQKKECRRNDGIIQKMYLGGRGTYYCENCQK